MIVVLEGVSCSGKSTLLNALIKKFPDSIGLDPRFGSDHHDRARGQVPEISEELHALQTRLRNFESKTLDDELDFQKAYIPLVRARLTLIATAAKQNNLVFAHRDLLSNYVQGNLRFRGIFSPGRAIYAKIFEDLCRNITPLEFADLHIISKIPWEVFFERSIKRQRSTWKDLQDEDYFSTLSNVYDSVASVLGERCLLLDGTQPIEENVIVISDWLLNNPWTPRAPHEIRLILNKLTKELLKGS